MYKQTARKTLKGVLTALVMVGTGACAFVEGCAGGLDGLLNDPEAQDAFMWGFDQGYEIGESLAGMMW